MSKCIVIPDDGIIRIPIIKDDVKVGERCIDLSDMPTIDAKPVVRGEWVKADYALHNGYMCSVCHEEVLIVDGMTPLENDMIFCPYCGADMRGETEWE